VIVRNDTSQGAKAYAIEWHVLDASGTTVTSFVRRHMATWLMLPAEARWIKPQDMRLIGPVLNVNPAEYQKYFAANTGVLAQIYQTHHLPLVPSGGSVQAGIDGVVFADGSFAGPNKLHLWERYVATRNAEHDEALAVFNLMKSGAPQAQVVHVLQRRANRALAATYFPGDDVRTWYRQALGNSARDMLRILRHQGSNGLLTEVNTVANYHPPKGTFTNMRKWTSGTPTL
jgi:hypothetical protein